MQHFPSYLQPGFWYANVIKWAFTIFVPYLLFLFLHFCDIFARTDMTENMVFKTPNGATYTSWLINHEHGRRVEFGTTEQMQSWPYTQPRRTASATRWPTDVNSSNDKTDLFISWYVALSYSKIHGHIWDSWLKRSRICLVLVYSTGSKCFLVLLWHSCVERLGLV